MTKNYFLTTFLLLLLGTLAPLSNGSLQAASRTAATALAPLVSPGGKTLDGPSRQQHRRAKHQGWLGRLFASGKMAKPRPVESEATDGLWSLFLALGGLIGIVLFFAFPSFVFSLLINGLFIGSIIFGLEARRSDNFTNRRMGTIGMTISIATMILMLLLTIVAIIAVFAFLDSWG